MRRANGLVAGLAGLALAAAGAADLHAQHAKKVSATLAGTGEVPAVSTPAHGSFSAEINESAGSVDWTLSYDNLQADVLMSHIHFGQAFANGGIVVWLCRTTQPSPPVPAGTADCPQSGTISGTFTASEVVSLTAQGIDAGDFAEVVRAMRSGHAYVNVHTAQSPGGEIRGQIKTGAGH